MFFRNEGNELFEVRKVALQARHPATYLVDVHHGLPLVVALQMEVAHSHLSKVTGMVFVQVGSVVVLTSGKTALGMSAFPPEHILFFLVHLHHRDACDVCQRVHVRR